MKYRHIKLLMNIIVAPERWMRFALAALRFGYPTSHKALDQKRCRCPPAPHVKIGIVTLKNFRVLNILIGVPVDPVVRSEINVSGLRRSSTSGTGSFANLAFFKNGQLGEILNGFDILRGQPSWLNRSL